MSKKYQYHHSPSIVSKALLMLLVIAGGGFGIWYVYQANSTNNSIKILPSTTPLNVFGTGIITYTDGTQNTFQMPNNPQSLSIIDPSNGKIVTSVEFDISISASYNYGTLTSWSVSLPYQTVIAPCLGLIPYTNNALYKSGLQTLTRSGSTFASGSLVSVASFYIKASDLQSLSSNLQPNTTYMWAVIFPRSITMTLNFQDGSIVTENNAANNNCPWWQFQYQGAGSVTSLSISWLPVPS